MVDARGKPGPGVHWLEPTRWHLCGVATRRALGEYERGWPIFIPSYNGTGTFHTHYKIREIHHERQTHS